MAILAIIFSANCSRIEQNNDPIIGIWVNGENLEFATARTNTRKEWIFNDVFLGRYHEFQNDTLTLQTDFSWSQEKGIYTIIYSGLENRPTHTFKIEKTKNGELLQLVNGTMLAIKE